MAGLRVRIMGIQSISMNLGKSKEHRFCFVVVGIGLREALETLGWEFEATLHCSTSNSKRESKKARKCKATYVGCLDSNPDMEAVLIRADFDLKGLYRNGGTDELEVTVPPSNPADDNKTETMCQGHTFSIFLKSKVLPVLPDGH